MRQRNLFGLWAMIAMAGLAFVVGTQVVSLTSLDGPASALAQEAPNLDEPASEPADAKQAAAPEKPAPKPAEPEETPAQSQSLLGWYFGALGWFYTIAFLLLSFCLVALVVMNILALRRDSIVPTALVEEFEQKLNQKQYQEAYELAKKDESFLGQVLSAGLAKLSSGYEPAIEAMQETGEEESMKLEHRLSYIGLIGTISPMVGLLGTVDGMVASFIVIAKSPGQPKATELAAGISTALVTTLVGLWLAIPAIAVFGVLRNRVARMVLEAGIVSEDLMSRFSKVGKKNA